jgi:hypothetical protein
MSMQTLRLAPNAVVELADSCMLFTVVANSRDDDELERLRRLGKSFHHELLGITAVATLIDSQAKGNRVIWRAMIQRSQKPYTTPDFSR